MYKLKQELPKEFKIKVNPKQSEALQKHLFSIGKKWGSGDICVKKTYDNFLYSYTYIFAANNNVIDFQESPLPRIKFKDYFEKVEEFPEKWCILVTEDNYQELNTWMHRNWKNYKHYNENWDVSSNHLTGYYRFHSHSNHAWSYPIGTETYTLITTEQFRAKYGKQPKVIIEASKIYEGILIDNAVELTKENDKLKHKILMLTEKLETIKKVIE